jgi:CRISPR-associated protein Cas8a1/Csx13
MAKVKPDAPDHLKMSLFAPGMSELHRAGLGGLACTLKAMERQHAAGLLSEKKLPGPMLGKEFPWEITDDSVTLKFGEPEKAESYLKKLFEFAFGIRKDGLIVLPGQYHSEPSAAVLADLQAGYTLTFLQHGRVRALAKEVTTVQYDSDGDGRPGIVVEYKKCSGFKHQNGYAEFVDKKGCLVDGAMRVDGPISPGTVVRHVAFTSSTGAEDPPERMLPLYFALVGCLALPVNRGVAALIVPDVENLNEFIDDRPFMTPTSPKECQIANAADAAFRAQVRIRRNPRRNAEVKLKARQTLLGNAIPGCYAMTFTPTPWASQQKSRVATIHVPAGDDALLDRYERVATYLPVRIALRTVKETSGKGKAKVTKESQESFRTDSIVRPLIAENLASGHKWYQDFVTLMTKINPANGKPFHNQLIFERKGLHAMTQDQTMWDSRGEKLVVQAVHEAISRRLGQIRKETDGESAKGISTATKNRWKRFREKLRLDLAGSKTQPHVRFALTDLFTRGGNITSLKDGWPEVLHVIRSDWQLARDLGLLALASYAGKYNAEDESDTTTETTENKE